MSTSVIRLLEGGLWRHRKALRDWSPRLAAQDPDERVPLEPPAPSLGFTNSSAFTSDISTRSARNGEPEELLYDRPIEHSSNHFRNSWLVIIFPPPILVFLVQVRNPGNPQMPSAKFKASIKASSLNGFLRRRMAPARVTCCSRLSFP